MYTDLVLWADTGDPRYIMRIFISSIFLVPALERGLLCCVLSVVPSGLLAFALSVSSQRLQFVYRHDITNKTSPPPLQRATHFTYMGERRKLLVSLLFLRGIFAARCPADVSLQLGRSASLCLAINSLI
jgi:hypothetical protein